MPQLQPPPYQDQQGTQRWSEWFRKINNLLSSLSISFGNADDVTLTGVTDNEIITYDSGTAMWINETLTEFGIVNDTTPQLGGDLDTNANNIAFDTTKGILDENGNEQVLFTTAASAVNYLDVANSAAAGRTTLLFTGDDTNAVGQINYKGSGTMYHNGSFFQSGTHSQTGNMTWAPGYKCYMGSGASFISWGDGGTVSTPKVTQQFDDDTGIWFPAAEVVGITGGGTDIARFTAAATAVNYLGLTNSATGSPLLIDAVGTDTDIDITLTPKGTGEILLGGDLDTNGSDIIVGGTDRVLGQNGSFSVPTYGFSADLDTGMFLIGVGALGIAAGSQTGIRMANSYVRIGFDGSVSNPGLQIGNDADTGIYQSANNVFDVSAGGVRMGSWPTVASGVNYMQHDASVTTAPVGLTAAGTDTDIGLLLTPKGTGQILAGGGLDMQSFNITVSDSDFILDESGNELMQWVTSGGATHYLRLRNASSTTPLALTAESSTADANFTLKPKGTGYMTIANQHFSPAVVVTGATHTVVVGNRYLLCDTTSNAITVNLLAAATAGSGYRLDVKITNATNAVTIDGSGSETIDGSTTLVLSSLYDNASLVCDGSNWHIL